jgi:hypothetical protein
VGELIDQQDAGTTRKGRIEVELLPYDASILDGQCRQKLEAIEQTFGIDAAVRLNITDDHVGSTVCGTQAARRFEHPVCFANAGGCPEEYAQPPALGTGLFGLYME